MLIASQIRDNQRLFFLTSLLVTALLAGVSALIGVSELSWEILWVSRIPRTLALIFSGVALGISGLLMQMIVRNRFVEPSTAGTSESAALGILFVTVLMPGAGIFLKMSVAAVFALTGTAVFLLILRRLPLRSILLVPLVGMVLGGVIDSITTFFAYRWNLLQSLSTWTTGEFSSVLKGRYELLWVAFLLAILTYFAADRFTVAGMGESFTTNLGLNHRRIVWMGLILVSIVTAVVVVTVGMIPFLGLVVPNIVSMMVGDHMRRSLPWVAILSAIFVLSCDIIGRLIRYPYEIPVGMVSGVIGGALFLYFLWRARPVADS